MFARASTDAARTVACLLKAEYLKEMEGERTAIDFLFSELNQISDDESKSKILADIGDRLKKDGRSTLAMAAYENALVCDVHNTGARFQLAYLYGENDVLRSLSVRHYRILLRQNPAYWSAENNLGWEYERLGLQYLKVKAWKAAFERGEDYALGNLMFSYLGAGFVDEAEKLYEEAPSYRKTGDRVVAAYNKLRKLRTDEDNKLDQIREGAESIWREISTSSVKFRGGI